MTAVVTRVDSYSCRGHVTTCPLPDLVPLQRESSGRLARSGGEIRSRSLGQLAAAPGRACLVKVAITNFAVIFTIFGHHPRPQTGLTQKSVNKHVVSYKSCMKPSTLKL